MSENSGNSKAMGVLAYLGILVLIPLLTAKDDQFARFHSNQGLVLLIVGVVVNIVVQILARIVPLVGGLLSMVCGIVLLVLMIMGIVNACKMEEKPLPIIGGITLLK